MKEIIPWLVVIVGILMSVAALGLYAVPYSDTIVGLAVLLIGILLVTKKK